MIKAGVNVFRVNFSHTDTTNEEHTANTMRILEEIRNSAQELGLGDSVGVLADLCGPKVRCNGFATATGTIHLEEGETIVVEASEEEGEPGVIRTKIANLVRDLREGNRILLDDGNMGLVVTERESETRIVCQITVGGTLKANKGINVPDIAISDLSALTEKDKRDAAWVLKNAAGLVDFFALSFVQRAEDVVELREFLEEHSEGKGAWGIVSKIEKPQAVDAIDAIIEVSDAIMVARGDLGIECALEHVPRLQKYIIERSNLAKKPVITATQMLESMISAPIPTRAEVADVANAILDGTDAVMLSGEAAVGQYPVQTVQMMVRIALDAEEDHHRISVPQKVMKDMRSYMRNSRAHMVMEQEGEMEGKTTAIGTASVLTAQMVGASAIVVFPALTDTSNELLSSVCQVRPDVLIVASEHSPSLARQHALRWGVFPISVGSGWSTAEDAMCDLESKIISSSILDEDAMTVLCSAAHPAFASLSWVSRIMTLGEAGRARNARNLWKGAIRNLRRASHADLARIRSTPVPSDDDSGTSTPPTIVEQDEGDAAA